MSHITNPLVSAAQLARCQARSARLPQPPELLDAVFFAVQCLTQAAGLLLELPQSTTARANVVLARYWLVVPGFVAQEDGPDCDYAHVSAAALYTVAKTGASPRSARDLANVYAYLATTDAFWGDDKGDKNINDKNDSLARNKSYLADGAYTAFHSRVLALEARILCALGFDTHVALPHPLAITYLQAMGFLAVGGSSSPADAGSPAHELTRRAVAYLNTALLSPQLLYLTHQPHELAVAAVYSAARDRACHMPADAPWWEVFDVDRETLGFLAVALRSVASWADSLRQTTEPLLAGGILTRRRVAEAAAAWETHASREGPQPSAVAS